MGWIMLRKDIDKMIETLNEDLIKHCFQFLKKKSSVLKDKENWKSRCEMEFQEEMDRINGYIDKYNLVVPMLQSQKFHIGLNQRIDRRHGIKFGPNLIHLKSQKKLN